LLLPTPNPFPSFNFSNENNPVLQKILSWDVVHAEQKMENQAVAKATVDAAPAVATD
jgi:hypothetical protein